MATALVIDGHPNPDSLTASIVRRYADGYGDAQVLALRDLDFDPNMRFGYRQRMTIEPDLASARQALHDAQTIVVASPMWWGSVPALLKGFFDRALLPQDEYRYSPNGLPEGLLKGRRGRLILLADTPWYALPILGTHAASQVGRHTLKFCGVRPFPVRRMLGVKDASAAKIEHWLEDAEALGVADARRDGRRSFPPGIARPAQAIALAATSSSLVATS